MAEPDQMIPGGYDPRDHSRTRRLKHLGATAHHTAATEEFAVDAALALNQMGSFDWDLDRGTFHLDEPGLAVFDLRADEYDGYPASLSVRVPPEEGARLDAAVSEALRDGLPSYGAYFRLRCRDGQRRWTHTQGRILRDGDGDPYRIIGIVRDATAELTHSELLRTLEEERRRQTLMVQETTEALSQALTVEDVTRVLTGSAGAQRFGADGLAVGLVDGDRFRLIAWNGPSTQGLDAWDVVPLDAHLPMTHVARTLTPEFQRTMDEVVAAYPRMREYLRQFPVGGAAVLPLVAQARPMGALALFYTQPQEFAAEHRNLCVALGGVVAQSLKRAMLFDQEREFATGLQASMLPRQVPRIPGGDVAVRYRAARTGRDVGGDWYDVIPLPQGRVGAVVGDVQGHDTHAAAVMGQLRIALRAYAAEGHPPATVLDRASRFLAELDTERFATCTYAQVDAQSGTVHVVRAGHLGPLVSDGAGGAEWPRTRGGLPLGLTPYFEDKGYPETQLHLAPGATLLLCTDGLVEQPGRDIQEGIDALTEAVCQGPREVDKLADHLSELLWERPDAEDDMALLLLRRATGPDGSGLPRFHQHVHQADPEGLVDARAAVRHGLDGWRIGSQAGDIELIADELVTNALMHTDGGALLGLELLPGHPRRVRIEVQDRSSAWPRRRSPVESATSGRGLLMVDKLTDRWGVEPRGAGKAVWCEFVLPDGEDGCPGLSGRS